MHECNTIGTKQQFIRARGIAPAAAAAAAAAEGKRGNLQHVGDTAGHARPDVSPHRAQHHQVSPSHVLAAVVTGALRPRGRWAHGKRERVRVDTKGRPHKRRGGEGRSEDGEEVVSSRGDESDRM